MGDGAGTGIADGKGVDDAFRTLGREFRWAAHQDNSGVMPIVLNLSKINHYKILTLHVSYRR